MKKIITLLLLMCLLIMTTACDTEKTDKLNILTTVYPIHYITEQIFEQGNIISIYPDGADVNNYALTEKRTKEYSKNNILIFNSLSNELNIAKNLINYNKNLHLIDISYDLKLENGLEELWLSPNYYLKIATTIKNSLKDYTNSKYINEEIETKYKKLAETLSIIDADLRNIAKSAKSMNRDTIVASSNMFKYLNSYGFNVISLEDEENKTPHNLKNIQDNLKNKNYRTIFIKDTEEKSELIINLEKECDAKIVTINTMMTLTTEEKNNNENYLTIMNNYIENIKKATLGEQRNLFAFFVKN